jgi:hypothetical protein
MIVDFFRRGSGSASSAVDYFLGQHRDREHALVLSGDPDISAALANGSHYAKKYTAGCLSFQEPDLSTEHKQQIMDSFERMLFAGLDREQYDISWIQHTDKQRLELNFLIPNIELTTGKRLQPYYYKADQLRCDTWKRITNHVFALHDPDDPINKQILITSKKLPKNKQKAQAMITDALIDAINSGLINNRDDMLQQLTALGFEIARTTKQSISIKDPDGGQNIRLKGLIYEQEFRSADQSIESEVSRASESFRRDAQTRFRCASERYQKLIIGKSKAHQQRYRTTANANHQSIRGHVSESQIHESNDYCITGKSREDGRKNSHHSNQNVVDHSLFSGCDNISSLRSDYLAKCQNQSQQSNHLQAKCQYQIDEWYGWQHSSHQLPRQKKSTTTMHSDRPIETDISRRLYDTQGGLSNDRDRNSTIEDDYRYAEHAARYTASNRNISDRIKSHSKTITTNTGETFNRTEQCAQSVNENREITQRILGVCQRLYLIKQQQREAERQREEQQRQAERQREEQQRQAERQREEQQRQAERQREEQRRAEQQRLNEQINQERMAQRARQVVPPSTDAALLASIRRAAARRAEADGLEPLTNVIPAVPPLAESLAPDPANRVDQPQTEHQNRPPISTPKVKPIPRPSRNDDYDFGM